MADSTVPDPDNGSAPSPMLADEKSSEAPSTVVNSTAQEHDDATAPAPAATAPTESTSPAAEPIQLVVSSGFPGEDDDDNSYDGYNSERSEISVDFGL